MCGIAGFCDPGRIIDQRDWSRILSRMGDAVEHRGPDGSGTWVSDDLGVALCHRRLAIIDLSDRARQPMESHDGRFVVSFNGEIYNHRELRRQLTSKSWRTESDTETLVECIAHYGLRKAIEKLRGMFAIAVIDLKQHKIHLIRDRLGEKPLSYGLYKGTAGRTSVIFGSQVDAIARHPLFEASVKPRSLRAFALHGYIGGQETIWHNVYKVLPGERVSFDLTERGCEESGREFYWGAVDFLSGSSPRGRIGDAAVQVELRRLLRSAVESQMISDVPLGAFLSGGIDSSLVTTELRQLTTGPLHTFSVGFADPRYDESSQARAVAKALGTTHHEITFQDADALGVVESLGAVYDEPFADSSQIPMVRLAQYAREYVTVALSGDGGDELFGGYERYRLVQRYWAILQMLPMSVRRGLTEFGKSSIMRGLYGLQQHPSVPASVGSALRWLKRAMPHVGSATGESLYRQIMTSAKCEALVQDVDAMPVQEETRYADEFLKQMMATDINEYLPGDILVKVDRAAMATGLETRVPLLDRNLVQWALGLPSRALRARQGGKEPLRKLLAERLPVQLMRHPKKGFGVPLDSWLRGPLREWAESKLTVESLVRTEAFSPERVRRAWHEHLSGQSNRQTEIWRVLMYQQWHEKNGGVKHRDEAVAA